MAESPGKRTTKYSDLSDEEFVAELRSRLPERSWTFSHLIELEQRGLEIAEGDAELHAALTEEYDKLRKSMEGVSDAFRKQFAGLEPLQEQLRETVKALSPKFDVQHLLPNFDIGRLTSPSFRSLTYRDFPVEVLEEEVQNTDEFDRLGAHFLRQGEEVHQSRRAQLEMANTAAAQLVALEKLVEEAQSRDWFDWLLLVLTAIAAIGALGAVVIALAAG